MRWRELTYEVNSPNIKEFHLKNPTLRHLMPLKNIPHLMVSIICKHRVPCILEKSGSIKARLKNFGNCLVWTKVFSICGTMAIMKDTRDLMFWETPLIDTISI